MKVLLVFAAVIAMSSAASLLTRKGANGELRVMKTDDETVVNNTKNQSSLGVPKEIRDTIIKHQWNENGGGVWNGAREARYTEIGEQINKNNGDVNNHRDARYTEIGEQLNKNNGDVNNGRVARYTEIGEQLNKTNGEVNNHREARYTYIEEQKNKNNGDVNNGRVARATIIGKQINKNNGDVNNGREARSNKPHVMYVDCNDKDKRDTRDADHLMIDNCPH